MCQHNFICTRCNLVYLCLAVQNKKDKPKEEHIKNYKLCIPQDINTQISIANRIAVIEREISELEEGIVEAKKMQIEILSSYLW